MYIVVTFIFFRPENVPRLFDLVRVQDEAILPVFYFALRDTLVAKDLDQATRIAYGPTRFRVVTLGGQLIDTSGMYRLDLFPKFLFCSYLLTLNEV